MRFALVALLVMITSSSSARADADPKGAQAHFATGHRLLNQRKFAEAIVELKAAYELDPRADYLYRLAAAYDLSGDRVNALDRYQKFLALAPKGKAADAAQHYVAAIEAERAANAADAKAQAEAEAASHQDTERVVAARARLEGANIRITTLDGEIKKRTAAREQAVAAAAQAHAEVVRVDAEVAWWRHEALAAPGGRGRWLRLGGTLLVLGGAAGLGASAWYSNDGKTTSDTLTNATSSWTTADDALVTRGQQDNSNLLIAAPIGAFGILAGTMLISIGEYRVHAPAPAAEHQAAVEGGSR